MSMPRDCFNFVHLGLDHLAFVRLSSRDRDVQNELVVNSRVLLVRRLQSPVTGIGGHCCTRIGRADLLIRLPFPPQAPVWFSVSTSFTCRSARLSQLTLARISEASMCTTSAVGSSPSETPKPWAVPRIQQR